MKHYGKFHLFKLLAMLFSYHFITSNLRNMRMKMLRQFTTRGTKREDRNSLRETTREVLLIATAD